MGHKFADAHLFYEKFPVWVILLNKLYHLSTRLFSLKRKLVVLFKSYRWPFKLRWEHMVALTRALELSVRRLDQFHFRWFFFLLLISWFWWGHTLQVGFITRCSIARIVLVGSWTIGAIGTPAWAGSWTGRITIIACVGVGWTRIGWTWIGWTWIGLGRIVTGPQISFRIIWVELFRLAHLL